MPYSRKVKELLATHYQEVAEGGIVEKAPSRLARGEGVQQKFFIMKIDLSGSTMMIQGRHKETYLKLVHTFLSTIDRIAQDFGADPKQMEYAGDGLFAYFPEHETTAERVSSAACYSMQAIDGLQGLSQTLGGMKPRGKIVLHYALLTVAKIGPRENSILTAIGAPIHYAAKIEKDIGAGTIRVTEDFYRIVSKDRKPFFSVVYGEKAVYKLSPMPALADTHRALPANTLASIFNQTSAQTRPKLSGDFSIFATTGTAQPRPSSRGLASIFNEPARHPPHSALSSIFAEPVKHPPHSAFSAFSAEPARQPLTNSLSSIAAEAKALPNPVDTVEAIIGYDLRWSELLTQLER